MSPLELRPKRFAGLYEVNSAIRLSDKRLFEPLGRRARLRARTPAVAQHMPELVAELVEQAAPIARGTVHDNVRLR